jgi:hypothetical protein
MHKIRFALAFIRTHQSTYWRYTLLGIAIMTPLFLLQAFFVLQDFNPPRAEGRGLSHTGS